jgi:hypothetical protein
MTTALLWIGAYFTVAVAAGLLLTAAIRHGERQRRAEIAQLMRARSAQPPRE